MCLPYSPVKRQIDVHPIVWVDNNHSRVLVQIDISIRPVVHVNGESSCVGLHVDIYVRERWM